MFPIEKLKERLKEAFPDGVVEAHDPRGSSDYFEVLIVSSRFEGLTPIRQHQLVYGLFAEELKGPIHALSLQTFTPSRYARQNGQSPG